MQAVPAVPFVVLSASPSIADKVLFLEMGTDDYIAVPFSPKELAARLHALRRRTLQFTPESFYILGDVMVDFTKVEVVRDHVQIPLAMKEFRTLEFMIENARRVISRDEFRTKSGDTRTTPAPALSTITSSSFERNWRTIRLIPLIS
jgi:DNA-binding response OmpR family regulator